MISPEMSFVHIIIQRHEFEVLENTMEIIIKVEFILFQRNHSIVFKTYTARYIAEFDCAEKYEIRKKNDSIANNFLKL